MTRAKYGNKPVTRGSESYRSKREAARHQELLLLQKAGYISRVRREVPYLLIPGQRRSDGKAERACSYVADFVYDDAITGATVVEDVKSEPTKTPAYVIKRKLMLRVHGISIKETA